MQWSADVTEHAHVQEIKVPAHASNNQNYYEQIAHYLNRSDKCLRFNIATYIYHSLTQRIPALRRWRRRRSKGRRRRGRRRRRLWPWGLHQRLRRFFSCWTHESIMFYRQLFHPCRCHFAWSGPQCPETVSHFCAFHHRLPYCKQAFSSNDHQ